MDNITLKRCIKKFDLFNYMETYNKDFKVKSDERFYYTTCWHCGKDKLFIHASPSDPYKGYWRCWVCGTKGDLFDIISHFEQVSRREAFASVASGGSEEDYTILSPILQIERNKWGEAQTVKVNPPIELPMNFRPLTSFPEDNPGYKYALSRGITREMMTKFDLKYNAMMCRVIFPITYRSKLIGWQGRAISTEMQPKMLNNLGFIKTLNLFNYDAVEDKKSIMIVEGPIDAVKGHKHNAVALLGKSISSEQYRLIMKMKWLKEIIIALDPDAYKEAEDLGRRFVGLHTVKMVRLPPNKDIGDCTEDEVDHHIKMAKFFNIRSIF